MLHPLGKSSLLAAIVAHLGGYTRSLKQDELEKLVPPQSLFDHANVAHAGNFIFCEVEMAFKWYNEYRGADQVTSLIFCVDHAM